MPGPKLPIGVQIEGERSQTIEYTRYGKWYPAWIQLRAIPVDVELQVVHRRGLRTGKGNTLGDVPTIDHRPMRDYPQPSGPSHYGTKPCEPLSA